MMDLGTHFRNWDKSNWVIGSIVVWLFQISALIGISIGFQDWFITKTPLNLTIHVVLLFWISPENLPKKLTLFTVLFTGGMLIEMIGVATGIPFGIYSYGENMGWKVLGVPLLIGCNWAVLVFITASIVNRFFKNNWLKAFLGASLMIVLDLPMEVVAPKFDFWTFPEGAPFINYVSWFATAFLMHLFVQKKQLIGDYHFSLQLFLAQLVFFVYLTFFLP
jgi:putative membrane protein